MPLSDGNPALDAVDPDARGVPIDRAMVTPMTACPYLGLSADRHTFATFACEEHRCWRTDTQLSVALFYQSELCLRGKHAQCPRFNDARSLVPLQRRPSHAEGVRTIVIAIAVLAALLSCAGVAFAARALSQGSTNRAVLAPTVAAASGIATRTGIAGVAPIIVTPTPTTASARATAVEPHAVPPDRPTVTVLPSSAGARPSLPVAATPTSDYSPAQVRQQVGSAVAALRTGQLEATIDYGNGPRAIVQVRFDSGVTEPGPRLLLNTFYRGITGGQEFERLTIGSLAWERRPSEDWVPAASRDGVWEQVLAYLPQLDTAVGMTASLAGDTIELRYYDPERDADTILVIDRISGTPRAMRQEIRASGIVIQVAYQGWNTSVRIPPPDVP